MNVLDMDLWPWNWLPLIVLGLVVPSVLAGGFQPALVRQKVIELILPAGALAAWVGMVHMLANLSDPSHVWPNFYSLLLMMALWGAFYVGVRLIKTQPFRHPITLGSNNLLPVLAVLSLMLGWWGTVALSSSASSFFSTEAFFCFLGIFGGLVVFRKVLKKGLGVMDVAKMSVQAGYSGLGLATVMMMFYMDDPSRLGPLVAMGILSSVYGLLLHQVLIVLSPLSPQTLFQKPGAGMLKGYVAHIVLLCGQWGLIMWSIDSVP